MEQIDTSSMLSMVNAFPILLTSTPVQKNIQDLCIKLADDGISGISIMGMGGSGIAGQYVQALFKDVSPIPIITVRDLELPAFIDDSWATISVSYSGNTEETLTVFAESLKRGCHSFAITSGGKLLSMDKALGTIKLKPGYQPRAAFPSIFSAVLQITESLLRIKRTDLDRIGPILQSRHLDWEKSQFSPKDMARDLSTFIPLFIGARHLIPVAYRSKCQMNENAKAIAFFSEIPESNHNEIESFDHRNDLTILPVLLRSQFEDDKIAARYEVISELYRDEGFSPIRFSMKSDSKIEEMLLMTFYLDLVTLELALLRGVDPTSVEKISKLKGELKNL